MRITIGRIEHWLSSQFFCLANENPPIL
jgi:hypothetical protein